MLTYFEAAKDIVDMYNDLAYMAAEYDESFDDHTEAVVLAVEALLLKAEKDKMEHMKENAYSALNTAAKSNITPMQLQSVGMFEPYSSLEGK